VFLSLHPLSTYNSRLRIYFYHKYISPAINTEIEVYKNAIRQTEITQEDVNKTAENLTANVVKFYGFLGLVKGKYHDLKELKNLKDNIPYSAIDPTNYNNRVRDFAIKKIAQSEGKDALIRFANQLAGKDTWYGRAISDCLVISKPSALDLLQCQTRLSGEAGKQLNGAIGEYNKLGYLQQQNAGVLVQDYLELYYAFNRRTDIFYSIITSMAKEEGRELTFTLKEFNAFNYKNIFLDKSYFLSIQEFTDSIDTVKNNDILREILDILSEKRFGNTTRMSDELIASLQYDLEYAQKMIVEYIDTVETLINYFTNNIDIDTIRKLDSNYIDFDVQLFPEEGDDLYKIAFQLTNNTPFDLKATKGSVTVELDGAEIDKVVFFQEQVDGKDLNENQLYSKDSRFYQSKVFSLPTDKKVLTNGVLKVSYEVNYIPSRHNAGEKVQEGVKYYELSKTTLIDNLSKPLITFEVPKFIKVDEEVKLDASSTTSIIEDDSFTYNWEYLSTDNQDNIGLTNSTSAIASIKVSKVPDNLAFQRHDFKLTVISNINKKESTREFSIFVKNEKQEEETVEDNTETTNNQDDSSDTPSNNGTTTPIDTTTLTLQECKDKTLNQTFTTNTWTTSQSEWNQVHIACLKIFSDNELEDSNIPDTGTNDDSETTDTPTNTSRTSIDYMGSHKTEKLVSTDCKVRNYQGWKDIKNELISTLAPADNMMKSIEGCIGVVQLIEFGGLSFDKAVESVVRSRTKETSPFSDVWDSSAQATPNLTVDDISDAQDNVDNSSNSSSGTLTLEKCNSTYGNYSASQWAFALGYGEDKEEIAACYHAMVGGPSIGLGGGQPYIDAYNNGAYGQ